MRLTVPPPTPVPALVRGVMAQQQIRTGVALEAAEAVEASFPPEYADDTEAAAGGIPINGVYRNGVNLVVRTV